MSIFKKSMKHSKSSHLNERIEMLDKELNKTGVTITKDDKINAFNQKETIVEDLGKIDWRKDLLEEENNPIDVEIDLIREDFRIKNNSLKKVDNHIKNIDKDFFNLRQEIFQEISENLLFNIPSIEQKIDKVLKIYDTIQEGLLNEPPSTKNSDPLTPLDQNFVTVDELNNHYKLFINRIQEQIATVGGGGETKLKYLDDIVGIATNASAYDGKFLKYNHSIGKFEFVTASGGGESYWISTPVGIHTLSNVGIGTTNPISTSKLTVRGGISVVGVVSTSDLFVTSSGIFASSALVIGNQSGTYGYIIAGSATTDTYTVKFPTITSDTGIAVTGIAQTFSALQTFTNGINVTTTLTAGGPINFTNNLSDFSVETQTTGSISLGGTFQTGRIQLGRSVTNQTLSLGTGASGVGTTKIINLGTNGLSGSFTQINIGPIAGVGTVSINSGTNVGIGTTIPISKLEVRGGDIKVGVNTSQGLILTSPNGTKYRLIVNDAGALSTVSVP
jgi:hypothetical protein